MVFFSYLYLHFACILSYQPLRSQCTGTRLPRCSRLWRTVVTPVGESGKCCVPNHRTHFNQHPFFSFLSFFFPSLVIRSLSNCAASDAVLLAWRVLNVCRPCRVVTNQESFCWRNLISCFPHSFSLSVKTEPASKSGNRVLFVCEYLTVHRWNPRCYVSLTLPSFLPLFSLFFFPNTDSSLRQASTHQRTNCCRSLRTALTQTTRSVKSPLFDECSFQLITYHRLICARPARLRPKPW